MIDALPDIDFMAPMHAGPGPTFVLGIALLGLGGFAAIVQLFARAAQLARAQRHEATVLEQRADWPLFAGPNRVVRGTVDCDDLEVPVKVEIVQHAIDHTSKNSKSHSWEEIHREVVAAPFYLVRGDGQNVLVEPDQQVLVIDTLETVPAKDIPRARRRISDVRRGETFFAYGDLHQGQHPRARTAYRDGAMGWILRPPRGVTRMLFATGSIANRYAGRVSFLRLWGAILLVIWSVFSVTTLGPFVGASLFGKHTVTHVTGQHTYTTKNKNSTTTHYVIETRTDDGFVYEGEVERSTYTWILESKSMGTRLTVPIIRTGSSTWASYLGDRPGAYWMALILGNIGAIVIGLVLFNTYESKAAWYDRKKLKEPGGPGHYKG